MDYVTDTHPLVATALYLGASLITRDESVRKAKIVKTVW